VEFIHPEVHPNLRMILKVEFMIPHTQVDMMIPQVEQKIPLVEEMVLLYVVF
jgi:hypothetical protein